MCIPAVRKIDTYQLEEVEGVVLDAGVPGDGHGARTVQGYSQIVQITEEAHGEGSTWANSIQIASIRFSSYYLQYLNPLADIIKEIQFSKLPTFKCNF